MTNISALPKTEQQETPSKVRLPWLAWQYSLLGIVIIYGVLSLYQINLPGLHYDEAFEAVPALQLVRGQPVTTFRNSGLRLGHLTLPLMTQDYIGAINTYAAIPFILLFGPTPTALRTMAIVVGVITLGLAYSLAYTLSGHRPAGLAAALLLSVEPTFIFWNRQGIFVTSVTAAIGLAGTLCWLRRVQGGSRRWSLAGAFLFGLGLYAKLLFLWLIVAVAGAAVVLNIAGFIKHRARMASFLKRRQGEITGVIAAFLLGCCPLIVYNFQTGGTFVSITKNATTSYYGVNNLAFGANLAERLNQFAVMLNGAHLWYLGQIIRNPVPLVVFGLVLMLVVSPGLVTSQNRELFSAAEAYFGTPFKAALFPFLVIGLVILASIGTVSALWVTHFAILMPWPAIAISVGGWFGLAWLQRLAPRRASLLHILAGTGAGLLAATNLLCTIRYHQALAESGGLSTHSDAIYDLSEWLSRQAHGPVVMMDWGLAAPVAYLSGGQVNGTEVFGYAWEPDIDLSRRLKKFINQPETLYLWRAPDEIIFDRSEEFKALYRPLNLEETIEAAFYERSGRPILGITRLVAKGTAKNPPK